MHLVPGLRLVFTHSTHRFAQQVPHITELAGSHFVPSTGFIQYGMKFFHLLLWGLNITERFSSLIASTKATKVLAEYITHALLQLLQLLRVHVLGKFT